MLFEEMKKKKDYATTFLPCLFLLQGLFIGSCAARTITQQGQGSGLWGQGLIQQVTQGESFDEYKLSSQWVNFRDQAPSSYIFKINSWSLLINSGKEKLESGVFEAGGQNWRMIIYPKGNKEAQVSNYISAYVALENPTSISADICAQVILFAYNQRRNKYLMFQEVPLNRFNALNSVAGSAEFISLSASSWFTEYLVDDNCVFGAEIHVYNDQPAKQQEILSMIKSPADGIFGYRIVSFSRERDKYTSADFVVGGRTWQLHVYPKGVVEEKGRSLSAFLYLADHSTLRPKEEIFVRGKLRVPGPSSRPPVEKPFFTWLNKTSTDWGRRDLLPLRNLNEYIVKASLTIQVEIEEMSQIEYLP